MKRHLRSSLLMAGAVLIAATTVHAQTPAQGRKIWQPRPTECRNPDPPVAVPAPPAAVTAKKEPDNYVVLLQNSDGSVGKVIVKTDKEQTLASALRGVTLKSGEMQRDIAEDKVNTDFAEAFAAAPKAPATHLIYFDIRSKRPNLASQAILPKIIEEARNRPGADISVIGHTDTKGEAEKNRLLGLARAQEVAAILKQAGLEAVAVEVDSFGEALPLIATPDEVQEPKNRRVEVIIR